MIKTLLKSLNAIKSPLGDLGVFCILFLFFFISCTESKQAEKKHDKEFGFSRDWDEIVESGELVVLTTYGSKSYFNYHGREMGYQYELARQFARDMKLKLILKVLPKASLLQNRLLDGDGDFIAYRMPITNESKQEFLFADHKYETHQVLVQAVSDTMITSLEQLIGKKVYVLADSKYEERLRNLNEEIGGGIIIRPVKNNIDVDKLIDDVSLGKIPFTIADEDIAVLNKIYLRNIDFIDISFPQLSAWAVRKTSPILLEKINEWLNSKTHTWFYHSLYYKYNRNNEFFADKKVTLYEGGRISPYDYLFKRYAPQIPWDWRLLASTAFYESTFDATTRSYAGAVGLMQVMPQTAKGLGFEEEELLDPETNIQASVKFIKQLDRIFSKVENPDERIKFILASYNAGAGHVMDAMELAEKYGKERYVWDNNVETYMRLKTNPDYHNDPVCNFGFCRGNDVADYVKNITTRYQRYKNFGVQ
jgi:membrane-bound lytic murein transglycosylase F